MTHGRFAARLRRLWPRSLFGQFIALHVILGIVAAAVLSLGVSVLLNRTARHYQRDLLVQQATAAEHVLARRPDATIVAATDLPVSGLSIAVLDARRRARIVHGPARRAIIAAAPLTRETVFFHRGSVRALSRPFRAGWIVVAQDSDAPQVVTDDIVRVFLTRFALLLLPFAALLPLIGALLTRRLTRRMRTVSAIAAGIGPRAIDQRLPRGTLPLEVEPLAVATNAALDRLEKGFRAQAAFAADIAHELRTPLAIVRLRAEKVADEEQRRALLDSLDRSSRVVGQLLGLADLERRVEDAGTRIDLAALAEEVVASRAPAILAGGRTIALDDRGAMPLHGFAGPLTLALENLVDNAVRHTPQGTHISVIVGPGTRLTVSDDGDGVPAEQRARLSERFFRGDAPRTEGHGIGLSIVQRVAEAHHGTLAIAPGEDGRGIAFTLRFRGA
ncbi:ATP-binding protein [uncultured Sphingomonas sp.]|uniref:sensor histidine kinase n=1 Tax=uncultured Sphingomonas sp. TaxID=158754 RepID=UPI0025913AA7|nr:ATP-binding protein [uncultured Sphingomonas sp.]